MKAYNNLDGFYTVVNEETGHEKRVLAKYAPPGDWPVFIPEYKPMTEAQKATVGECAGDFASGGQWCRTSPTDRWWPV